MLYLTEYSSTFIKLSCICSTLLCPQVICQQYYVMWSASSAMCSVGSSCYWYRPQNSVTNPSLSAKWH